MTKTIHFRWENRFVLQWYRAVRKLYRKLNCYPVYSSMQEFEKKNIWRVLWKIPLSSTTANALKTNWMIISHEQMSINL